MAQKKSIIVPRWLSYNEDVVGDYTVLDSTGKPIKVVDPVTGKTINQVIEGVSNRPIRDLWQNQYLLMETLMPFANIKSISSADSEAQGTANLEVDTLYNATVDGPYNILLPRYKMVGGSSVALAAGDSVRIKMQEGSIDQFTIRGDVSSGGYPIGDQDSTVIPPTENYFDYTFKFNGTSWDKFSSSGQDGVVKTALEKLDLGEGSALPVGVPVPWPSATPPTGWLKCNGAPFTAQEYPKLASVYPSLKLPDLRGEFIRGWDDGRGVDASRTLLSSQADAIRNIVGQTGLILTSSTTHGSGSIAMVSQNYYPVYNNTPIGSINDNGSTNTVYREKVAVFDASKYVPTANENRPRNVAFNYIVRAA